MAENEKIQERKQWNAPFLRAFDYVAGKLQLNQTELAKKLQTNGSLISSYRSGKRRVSEEMMERLLRASNCRLYMPYLKGESAYMLVANVPESEIIEYKKLKANPDYQAMRQSQAVSPSTSPFSQLTPQALDNLIEIHSRLIRQLDDLRIEFKQSLETVQSYNAQMAKLLEHFPHPLPKTYIETPDPIHLVAEFRDKNTPSDPTT